jgi:inorganic pyrophosphatase
MNLGSIPTFASDDVFHVVVESPKGSALKLKYAPRWEAMTITRPLPVGLTFAFDWGFVPSTRAADDDPIDAILLWDVSAHPGLVVPCRTLGVLRVEQNASGEDASGRIRNDRILALPIEARREREWTTFRDLSARTRAEYEEFTLAASALEGKAVELRGWGEPAEALALLRAAAIPNR